MEMYQQLERETKSLDKMEELNAFYDIKTSHEQAVRSQVTKKFAEWHLLLNSLEARALDQVSGCFNNFEPHFEKQQTLITSVVNNGSTWMQKVHGMLDSYTAELQRNPEHIAFDLLDNNPLNESSVEYLYSEAEEWMNHC